MNDLIGGTYRLECELGRGGMGTVWQARHERLGHAVAVKILHPSPSRADRDRARFEREALISSRLRSRHIPLVTDCGLDEARPFMVMERLRGEDLGAWLRREGTLSVNRQRRVVEHIARALEVTHAAGVVHRDLKPSNVFLHQEDGREVAKLLDFGVAKLMDDALEPLSRRSVATTRGTILGSPRYMSPEQIHGDWEQVGPRADLWALAVIIYQCLTGCVPFGGNDFPSVVIGVCEEEPGSVQRHGWPGALDDFFRTALAKRPEERFDSAESLRAAFEWALHDGPASAVYSVAVGSRRVDECPTLCTHAPTWS